MMYCVVKSTPGGNVFYGPYSSVEDAKAFIKEDAKAAKASPFLMEYIINEETESSFPLYQLTLKLTQLWDGNLFSWNWNVRFLLPSKN